MRRRVSIHAPTRGATSGRFVSLLIFSMFQSTLPRGERRSEAAASSSVSSGFNPRSHEGSDISLYIVYYTFFMFQSTLPRGERRVDDFNDGFAKVFQSTLPRGERLYDVYIVDSTIVTSSFLRM